MSGIDAYEIGVRLVLNDSILGSLANVDQQFQVVEATIKRINDLLSQTVGMASGLATASGRMASAWKQAATAANQMATAMSKVQMPGPGAAGGGYAAGGGGYVPPGAIPGSAVPLGTNTPRSAGYYPAEPSALAVIPGQGPRGPQGWGWTGNNGYVPPGGPSALAIIPGQGPGGPQGWGWTGNNGYVPPGAPPPPAPPPPPGGGNGAPPGGGAPRQPGGFSPLHAMSTIFSLKYGTEMVAGTVGAVVGPSFDVQDQLQNIRNMTPRGADANAAAAQAMALAQSIQQNPATPGITLGQALAMISNLYSVDRNMDAVSSIAPEYATDGYTLAHAQGGDNANDELYSILRGAEDLGRFNFKNPDGSINTAKAMSFIDLYTRLIANSNGNLTGTGAMTLIGQAGPGATQLSDKALARAILSSQALSPSQVGTGLNAMTQEFIGGKMSQATARALHDAGVLPDSMFGKDGKILEQYKYGIGQVLIPPEQLKDTHLALTDSIDWASKYLFGKYLNSDGSVKTGDQGVVDGLITDMNRDFSRIPGMRLAGYAVFNSVVQDRQMGNVAGLQPNAVLAAGDASTAKSQATGTLAAWNALLTVMGIPMLPDAAEGFHMLTGSLNALSNAATQNPGGAKVTDEGILDAVGYGVVKLLSYAPKWAGGGLARGLADTLEGPVGFGVVVAQIVKAFIDNYNATTAGDVRGGPITMHGQGLTPSNPIYVKQVGMTTPSTQPSSPTQVNPGKSLPPPGQPWPR
jgi:hypothetical protein